MEKENYTKIVELIEGYYSRKLDKNELLALKDELKDKTYEVFINDIKLPLLKKVEYFSVANLHKIIEDYRELEEMKRNLGIKSFDELYEN